MQEVYISGHPATPWVDQSPADKSPGPCSGLRSLRLKDFFIHANISSKAATLLHSLSTLQHLHYSGRAPIHTNACAALSHTLRSFTISGYAVEVLLNTGFKPGAIVVGVGEALASTAARSCTIASVTVYGCDVSTPETMIDYIPLQNICEAEGIPYFRIGQDTDVGDMEIRSVACQYV